MLLQKVAVNPAGRVDDECFFLGVDRLFDRGPRLGVAAASSSQPGKVSLDFSELLDRLEGVFLLLDASGELGVGVGKVVLGPVEQIARQAGRRRGRPEGWRGIANKRPPADSG